MRRGGNWRKENDGKGNGDTRITGLKTGLLEEICTVRRWEGMGRERDGMEWK